MDIFAGRVKVDHFRKGAEVYFLTHFHKDHMTGLRRGWHAGRLYCTAETAALLRAARDIPEESLCPLALGRPEKIVLGQGADRVTVTALDANHCPGAAMLLFEHGEERVLVTGDFRLDDDMRGLLPELAGVDRLYVDATYDDPADAFPPQQEVIADILSYVRDAGERMVVVETYSIGKNKVLEALYRTFRQPFYLDPWRWKLYRALGYRNLITDNPETTRFFACGSRHIDRELGKPFAGWRRRAVVISPTGWAARNTPWVKGKGFPYSEHCSGPELREFVEALSPGRIVVTEGGKATERKLPFACSRRS
jgi:Cft2 family RNA processing exonuclease